MKKKDKEKDKKLRCPYCNRIILDVENLFLNMKYKCVNCKGKFFILKTCPFFVE